MAGFRQHIAEEGRKNRAAAIDTPHVRNIVQCPECHVWHSKGHKAEAHAEMHEMEGVTKWVNGEPVRA